MTPEEQPQAGESRSVVRIQSPDGRVLLWLEPESPIRTWKVGDAVDFRNSPCVVLERSEDESSLSLTLGLAA
jgi:hypothetical protein